MKNMLTETLHGNPYEFMLADRSSITEGLQKWKLIFEANVSFPVPCPTIYTIERTGLDYTGSLSNYLHNIEDRTRVHRFPVQLSSQ